MSIESRKKQILFVDDEPSVRTSLKNTLQNSYVLSFADSGESALSMDLTGFDVIFIDINMPGLSGIDLTKIIRRNKDRSVPIIGMSTSVREDVRALCFSAGMDDVISKPIFIDDIRTIISCWSS